MGGDDGRNVLKLIQLRLGPRDGGIRCAPIERQQQEALPATDEGMTGVVAVRRCSTIGRLIRYPGRPEIIQVSRWTAHVVVQAAVDVMIARGVPVLNP